MTSHRDEQSAICRITASGHLRAAWSEILRDREIVNSGEADAKQATITGCLPDQAALLRMLNALRDWHVPVLTAVHSPASGSVNRSGKQIRLTSEQVQFENRRRL